METNEFFDKKCKDAYYKLKNSGIFFDLYPHFSGLWSKDKIKWQKEYKKMIIDKLKK